MIEFITVGGLSLILNTIPNPEFGNEGRNVIIYRFKN